MKRMITAVSLLLVAGMLTGCNKTKDEVLPDGTKRFGVLRLKGGTEKAARVEHPDGEKLFDVTLLPDGTLKTERAEFPTGEKEFDSTKLPDGTFNTARAEFPTGEKQFDTTKLPDGTYKIGREEFPDGKKQFDVSVLPDGTTRTARVELPSGEKQFEVFDLPDGTEKVARDEFPNGEKWFDVTLQTNGVEKAGRVELPDGTKESAVIVKTGVPFADGALAYGTDGHPRAKSAGELRSLLPVANMVEKTADEHFAVLGITTGQTFEEVNAHLTPYGFKPLTVESDDGLGGGCRQGTTDNPSVANLRCDTLHAKFDSAKNRFVEDDDYALFFDMYFCHSRGGQWVLTQFHFSSTALENVNTPITVLTATFGRPTVRKTGWARWDSGQRVWVATESGAARFTLFDENGLFVQDSALIKELLD